MSKVWFVTGSSRGLGREIVEAVLNAGDSVVATARKPEQLNDLSEKCGDWVLAIALEVCDSAAVAKAVAEGHKAFGRYDVVVKMQVTAIRLPSKTPLLRASRNRSLRSSSAWST